MELRLTTHQMNEAGNVVRHSYYVSVLRWVALKLWERAENIVENKFAR